MQITDLNNYVVFQAVACGSSEQMYLFQNKQQHTPDVGKWFAGHSVDSVKEVTPTIPSGNVVYLSPNLQTKCYFRIVPESDYKDGTLPKLT